MSRTKQERFAVFRYKWDPALTINVRIIDPDDITYAKATVIKERSGFKT